MKSSACFSFTFLSPSIFCSQLLDTCERLWLSAWASQPVENLRVFGLPEILIFLFQLIDLILGRNPRRIVGLAYVALDTIEMLASVVDLLLEREHVGIFFKFLFDPSTLLRIALLSSLLAIFLPCLVSFTLLHLASTAPR